MAKMDSDHQEFAAKMENRGVLNSGKLIFGYQGIAFRNQKTGKTIQAPPGELDKLFWIRMAGSFGLKVCLKNGQMYRFSGFKEADFETFNRILRKNYQMDLSEEQKSFKGWNWGSVKFPGSQLEFAVDKQIGFSLPLTYVSQCNTAKNEGILEFHPNDEAAVSLVEMRFYIPQEGAEGDPLESFHQNVMSKADVIQATGDALLSLNEVPCLTPRGRYELKVYPTFLQLHGKTFDYKIPYNSVLRIFLLPHVDGRQVFFVLSLDPPIKQGQTRYPFLILNFKKDEDPIEVELEISDAELKEKYDGRLERNVSGLTYEVLGRVMKGLVNRKITTPGAFRGQNGSAALSCSYKAAAGFLYPLDRGFVYVHKPAIHIRFDEVSSVNFARSGGNTRSFDFDVETRNGGEHTFSGISKEEYQRLYDFVVSKGLRIKNRAERDEASKRKPIEEVLDSDDEEEHDPYLVQVKNEAKQREEDEDEEDEDFRPPSETSDVAEEYDSDAKSSSSSDEEGESSKKKEKKEKKTKKRLAPDNESSKAKRSRKDEGSKKSKDPNMPKRPQSAYFLFMNDMRERIKAENPGISITDIGKKASEMWKVQGDKSKWEKKAEEEKEQYNEALKVYRRQQAESGDAGGSKDKDSLKLKSKSSGDSKKSLAAASSKSSPLKIKSKEYISSSDDSSSSDDERTAKKADSDDSD